MQEAIGPSSIGPAAFTSGRSLIDGPCGYSCGIGSAAFEQMMGSGISKAEAVKVQARELAFAKTELIDQIPISVYQLKVRKISYIDKVTNQIREEDTLVSPEFGTISKFTNAGDQGTGSSESYTRIINRAHDLASTKGPVSMLWLSPGEPVKKDGIFVPEHRAYVWKKDSEDRVNAYQYLLTGTEFSLTEMMKKLGFQGDGKAPEDQVIVRGESVDDFTHQEIYEAFESSLSAEEKTVYGHFLDNFRIDARIPDSIRIYQFNNYQEVFAKELDKEFKKQDEDMQQALQNIVHGFIGISRNLDYSIQNSQSVYVDAKQIEAAQPTVQVNNERSYPAVNITHKMETVVPEPEFPSISDDIKKSGNETEDRKEAHENEPAVFTQFISGNAKYQEFIKEIEEIGDIGNDHRDLAKKVDSWLTGILLLKDTAGQKIDTAQAGLIPETESNSEINRTQIEPFIIPAVIHLTESVSDSTLNSVLVKPQTGILTENQSDISQKKQIKSENKSELNKKFENVPDHRDTFLVPAVIYLIDGINASGTDKPAFTVKSGLTPVDLEIGIVNTPLELEASLDPVFAKEKELHALLLITGVVMLEIKNSPESEPEENDFVIPALIQLINQLQDTGAESGTEFVIIAENNGLIRIQPKEKEYVLNINGNTDDEISLREIIKDIITDSGTEIKALRLLSRKLPETNSFNPSDLSAEASTNVEAEKKKQFFIEYNHGFLQTRNLIGIIPDLKINDLLLIDKLLIINNVDVPAEVSDPEENAENKLQRLIIILKNFLEIKPEVEKEEYIQESIGSQGNKLNQNTLDRFSKLTKYDETFHQHLQLLENAVINKLQILVLKNLFNRAKLQNLNLEKIKIPAELKKDEINKVQNLISLLLCLLKYSEKEKYLIHKFLKINTLHNFSVESKANFKTGVLYAPFFKKKKTKNSSGLIYKFLSAPLYQKAVLCQNKFIINILFYYQ